MVQIQPVRIPGWWREGRALDVHTVDNDERWRLLEGLHEVDKPKAEGRNVRALYDQVRHARCTR